jgi:carboxymethylenebutenolidase
MASATEPTGVEVSIPAGDDFPETPAFAIVPDGATRGVVVIHELYGRQPEIDRVVARFAARGYAAVAPDLFRAPSTLACMRRTMRAMRTGDGPAVNQARAVRAWRCARAAIASERVGLIGFCFGGGFALACGARRRTFAFFDRHLPPSITERA